MKILYVYRTARQKILEKSKKGLEPDHQLYGANHLKGQKFKVEFSDIAYSPINLLHFIFFPLEKFLIKITSIGFKLDQAILLLPKAITADLVITTADSAGLPFALFKKIGVLKKPLIYISTGLINELTARKKNFIYKTYRRILFAPDAIICHSEIEKELFQKLVPQIKNKVHFLYFGIDENYFKSSKTKDIILSIGRDRSRDFGLVAKVAKKFPNEQFAVVTSRSNIANLSFPKNVKLYFDLPYTLVKKLYFQAKIVFLPLKELNRASGQISLLESLAANCKVVISKIHGIEDYLNIFKNARIYLFKSGSENEAVIKIREALTDKKPEKKISIPTSKFYAKNIARIIKQVV